MSYVGRDPLLKTFVRTAVMVSIIASVLTLNVRPAKAATTIYIRADGTVDPPGSPIQRNGNLYTFTDNIYGSIVVQRDNIKIDGAARILQGTAEIGIDVSSRTNVTIRNVSIKAFDYGVYLSGSTRINISKSNIIDNYEGIWLSSSDSNTISSNNITSNTFDGIYLYYSSNNAVSGNNVTGNIFDGIYLSSSSDNSISDNNVAYNGEGIASYYSANNRIVHNNFIGNSEQVYTRDSEDIWDNGCEGNYWSDYDGTDLDGDGVGDTKLLWNGVDACPLMNRYWISADVNHDLIVDIIDVVMITAHYNSAPSDPKWNPHSDIAEPYGLIDIFDVITCTSHYDETL